MSGAETLQEAVPVKRKPGRPKGSGPKIEAGSRDARQVAAAILEVLAGIRLPSDAASAVGVSLARYYQLESRALEGLVAGCEPRPKGRQARPADEAAHLRDRVAELEREVQRRQALLRASQRTVGLAEPKAKEPDGKKRRKRKPTVRALRAVEVLRSGTSEAGTAPIAEEASAEA